MEAYQIYVAIGVLLLVFYGIPFFLLKGDSRVYKSLVYGSILFYVFAGVFVLLMNHFNWDDGNNPLTDIVVISLLVSLPFVLISNIVIALIYWLISKFKSKN